MTMQENNKNLINTIFKRDDVRFGLILGGVTVFIYLLTYYLSPKAYFGSGVSIVTLFLYLVAMWKISKSSRDNYLGSLEPDTPPSYSFSAAIQPPFIVFLVAQSLYYIQYYLMFNWIDPSMVDVAREYAFEALDQSSGLLGSFMDESTIDEIYMEFEKQDFGVTVGNTLMSWARSLIGGFILSSIFALIYKRTS